MFLNIPKNNIYIFLRIQRHYVEQAIHIYIIKD